MNWIIKNGDYVQFDSDEQKAIVTLEQKGNFSGIKGEDVLILEKTKSEWQFTAHYRISYVNIKILQSEYKEIKIGLNLVKKIESEKLLEDYIYSLRRITNYANPLKHFSRKYSRLFDAEYEAIVEDKLYVKRTMLGTILNAMHRDHQEAFISYLAIENPELLTGSVDINKALNLLITYMNNAIIKPAQYLKESAEILKEIISETDYSQVGFALDNESITKKTTQVIKPQVDLIDEHLSHLPSFLNQKLALQLLELEDNARFKRLFKNSRLPISLN